MFEFLDGRAFLNNNQESKLKDLDLNIHGYDCSGV